MYKKKIIVGISGTSGVIIGIKFLEVLRKLKNAETHLIITDVAKKIIQFETNYDVKNIEKLADFNYKNCDFFAPISSGSFKIDGMVVIPCSMKTLSGIANGYSESLLLRAADVTLKERRKLVLVPRETPLNLIHIENMKKITLSGGIILPPVLTFYSGQKKLDDVINHIIGKILDLLEIKNNIYKRWK